MSHSFRNGKPGPETVTEIGVEKIVVDPARSDASADGRVVAELAAAIKRRGTVEPVVVRPAGNVFELVAGERRFRAARLAGLKTIPAIIRDLGPEELEAAVLVEKLQHEGLGVIEEARVYRRLVEEFGVTQSEIGRLVGKGQSTIANKLRLLRLPERVQARVMEGGVSERHARALLDLDSAAAQVTVLEEILRGSLSVRETEERVRSLKEGGTAGGGEGLPATPAEERVKSRPGRRGSSGVAATEAEARTLGIGSGEQPVGPRAAERLVQVGDRRAIRVFRDIRLFLNTFRRAVEMLRESGIQAEMKVIEGPEVLEVRVVVLKGGPGATVSRGEGG